MHIYQRHVLSQSNLCERLFSLAKLIITDRRQSMHPSTLNNFLLLKLNHTLWSVSGIHHITIGDGEPAVELSEDEEHEEEGEEVDDEAA